MSGLIYFIVIIVFISRIASAVKKMDKTGLSEVEKEIQERYAQNSLSGQNNTSTHSSQSSSSTAKMSVADMEAQKARIAANLKSRSGQSSQQNRSQQTQYQTKTEPEEPVVEERKKSTTEILNEKAMEDQRQHQIEKRQHEMEERRIHGMLRYAGRHYPGDDIPRGMREVICEYCNAENLVPSSDYTTKYNCYFCREIL